MQHVRSPGTPALLRNSCRSARQSEIQGRLCKSTAVNMSKASTISTRIAALRARIDELTLASGRPAGSVTLLPVSKTFGVDAIQEAIASGMRRFGENKAQDIRDKSKELAGSEIQWVMIGHLQTNKARDIARYAHEIQSLDRQSLADALEKRLQL